ncbi:MAG: type II toxin-antitoxin system Phd/YefM family antitoxin [Blastocatellia bacterium]
MQIIDITDLTPQIQELLSWIKSGEEIIITFDNQPLAKLVLVNGQANGSHQRRQAGMIKGEAWMSPDFNEPLEDFAEYMP